MVNGVLGLQNENPLAGIYAYPNPVSSQENIEVQIPDGVSLSELLILDGMGKEVGRIGESDLNGQNQVSLNNYVDFSQGVYYLRFANNDHSHIVKLIVL
jgi:hypothetical protein